MITLKNFTVKNRLTKPLISMAHTQEFYGKILGAITESDIKVEGARGDNKMQLCDAVDLQTGEAVQLICSAIMVSSLNKLYHDDTYIGKCFAFVAGTIREGKKYRNIDIYEIEEPASGAPNESNVETQVAPVTTSKGRK